jgi:hypothetical protein
MPRGDGTGPAGMGPLTGRAAGYCAGYGMPGYANPWGGRMRGAFGWGRGRFWGYGGFWGQPYGYSPYGYAPYGVQYSAEQEKDTLQSQVEFFEGQIEGLKKRIEELESESTAEKP